MKIVMTLLVWNNDDTLNYNIEYHKSQGIDKIIIMDNNSVDKTKDIIRRHERDGFVYSLFEDGENYDQVLWLTKIARLAYTKFHADWVINIDADEFVWPKGGNIRESFKGIPKKYNCVNCVRHNFLPESTTAGDCFYDLQKYRWVKSKNNLNYDLPGKVFHRGDKEVTIQPGCHSIKINKNKRSINNIFEIFHFPMRSYSKYEEKVIKGGIALDNNPEYPGETWRHAYSLYKEGELMNYYKSQLRENVKNGIIYDDRFYKYMKKMWSINNDC